MNALLALVAWILVSVGGYTPVEACQMVRSGEPNAEVCAPPPEVQPQGNKAANGLTSISNGF